MADSVLAAGAAVFTSTAEMPAEAHASQGLGQQDSEPGAVGGLACRPELPAPSISLFLLHAAWHAEAADRLGSMLDGNKRTLNTKRELYRLVLTQNGAWQGIAKRSTTFCGAPFSIFG